jgi:hypothetical protein
VAIILLGVPFFHYWRKQSRQATVIETKGHAGDFKEW